MDDWRKFHLNVLNIIRAFLLLFTVLWIYKMTLLTFGNDPTKISNGLSALGIMLSFLILIMTFYISADQQNIAIKLSLLESQLEDEKNQHERERQHFKTSIDKFYLPLLNLLSCHEDEAANLVKLNEINCHRYLAKKCVLCYYVPFYDEYVETEHLPESMSSVLLKMVNAEINALNDKLLKEYSEMSE